MKTWRKLTAAILVVLMTVSCFAGTAAAATENTRTRTAIQKKIEKVMKDVDWTKVAKKVKKIGTDLRGNPSVVGPALIYYDHTLHLYLPTIGEWVDDKGKEDPDFKAGLKDLVYGINVNIDANYVGSFIEEAEASVDGFVGDGFDFGNDLDKAIGSIPGAGQIYKATGPFGKIAAYTFSYGAYAASNITMMALAVCMVGIAFVVIIPLTIAATPFLIVKDGKDVYKQIMTDLNAIQKIIAKM